MIIATLHPVSVDRWLPRLAAGWVFSSWVPGVPGSHGHWAVWMEPAPHEASQVKGL